MSAPSGPNRWDCRLWLCCAAEPPAPGATTKSAGSGRGSAHGGAAVAELDVDAKVAAASACSAASLLRSLARRSCQTFSLQRQTVARLSIFQQLALLTRTTDSHY